MDAPDSRREAEFETAVAELREGIVRLQAALARGRELQTRYDMIGRRADYLIRQAAQRPATRALRPL